MSTYATFYLSRAQKFEIKTSTDPERGETKIELKTGFDNITIGLSQEQTKQLVTALKKEVDGGPEADRDVPF
jgi:hypothetical protein